MIGRLIRRLFSFDPFPLEDPPETITDLNDDRYVQYPHCDQRVLHAPGECKFCDKHPDWQQQRVRGGLCFTGHDPRWMEDHYAHEPRVFHGWQTCPADAARPPGADNDHRRWGGNRPTSSLQDPEWPEETFASRVFYGEPSERG